MSRILLSLSFILAASWVAEAEFLDTNNRWLVRDYHNAAFAGVDQPEMGWSGSFAPREAGTLADDWQQSVLNMIKFYRAMAGVPADIEFAPELSASAQTAALMMGLQNQISHYPTEDWSYYTADGALAAAKGNLAMGLNGVDAIVGYIQDDGANNAEVGHRRWLLFPTTSRMGNGDVPSRNTPQQERINVLWVHPDQDEMFATVPTREEYIAWPPAGYVPAPLVYARWSFSMPGVDFSNASVEMSADGEPLALEGDEHKTAIDLLPTPTIVWIPAGSDPLAGISWATPTADQTINVTVRNIRIGQQTRDFSYQVKIFDPEQAGPEEQVTEIAPFSTKITEDPVTLHVATRPWSEGLEVRAWQGIVDLPTYDAETDDTPFLPLVGSGYAPYNETRRASGERAFGLFHPSAQDPFEQILAFEEELLINAPSATISFRSSLSLATEFQKATVEASLGGSGAWQTLWELAGSGAGNSTFSAETIELGQFAGKSVRLRFRYWIDVPPSGASAFFGTSDDLGWAFDDIRLEGVALLKPVELEQTSFSGSPVQLKLPQLEHGYLQAREIVFGGLQLPWGPVLAIGTADRPNGLKKVVQAWTEDPVTGGNFQPLGSDFIYSAALGWINDSVWPWLFNTTEWLYYLRGTYGEGLWLYDAKGGFIYTREGMNGSYLRFDAQGKTEGVFLP